MKLQGKVAIVTGASRGIGKAIAKRYVEEGAKVVIVGRSEVETERLPGSIHKTVEEIEAQGGEALAVRCDVRFEDQVEAMVQRTLDAYGVIDILVNNAAASVMTTFREISVKHFDLIMDVNVKGYFLCIRGVLPTMMERKSGVIINISSGGGDMTAKAAGRNLIYGISKASENKMALGLSEELREFNISVNALMPSRAVLTEGAVAYFKGNVPPNWGVVPEDMAEACLQLALQTPDTLTGWVGTDTALQDAIRTS